MPKKLNILLEKFLDEIGFLKTEIPVNLKYYFAKAEIGIFNFFYTHSKPLESLNAREKAYKLPRGKPRGISLGQALHVQNLLYLGC